MPPWRGLPSGTGTRRARFRLVYASGRRFDSVIESIDATELPEPDVIVAGVGTEVRWFAGGETLPYWHDRLARRWDARGAVRGAGPFRCLATTTGGVSIGPQGQLSRRPAPGLAVVRHPPRIDQRRACAEVIYSSDRDLDVVPAGAGKGAAATFLAEYWQLPAERVLVSGDSGNDLAMFLRGFRGIVVANAHPDLKALAGPNVFRSQFAFADGVLDGLRYWLGERAAAHAGNREEFLTIPEPYTQRRTVNEVSDK